MEALEKAKARMSQRMDPSILEPVNVRSVNDIKAILAQFDPASNPVSQSMPLAANVEVPENGKKLLYHVTASTKSKSRRDMIIEGLDIVKNRSESEAIQKVESIEINGRKVDPPRIGAGTSSYTWVDPLIKQWFGGSRDGLIIYWDLSDGYRYKYDIYEHRLTRTTRHAS